MIIQEIPLSTEPPQVNDEEPINVEEYPEYDAINNS